MYHAAIEFEPPDVFFVIPNQTTGLVMIVSVVFCAWGLSWEADDTVMPGPPTATRKLSTEIVKARAPRWRADRLPLLTFSAM